MLFTVSSDTLIKYNGNEKHVPVTDGLRHIGDSAFEWCDNIEEITLPDGIISIGDDAFYGCKKLKKINLPDTLISIGKRAFSGCSDLSEITVPELTETIGEYAFEWCGIEKIILPEKIKTIGDGTFRKCRKLKEIHIPSECISLGNDAFSSCTALTDFILPDTVVSIGNNCFKNCASLAKIHLSGSLESAGSSVFAECISLQDISIPAGVTVIPDEAFAACVNLSSANLHTGITSIGKRAFRRCLKLRSITFPPSLKNIGDDAFSGCSMITPSFSAAPDTAGRTIFPNTGADAPDGIKQMYISSFIRTDSARYTPDIIIPESVRILYSGYEKLLTSEDMQCEKTCLAHVLTLKKYNCKVFTGSRYYPDGIVFENEFDFTAYDNMFPRSLNEERHLIAAYRLAYPLNLNEEHKKLYESSVEQKLEETALFAIKMRDPVLLDYVIKKADFSQYVCDMLYEEAKKTKQYELLSIINTSTGTNNGNLFDFFSSGTETDDFRYTLTNKNIAIITHCRTDSSRIMIPAIIDNCSVRISEDCSFETVERIILPENIFYPGKINGCVADFTYCRAKIYVPDSVQEQFCRSFIYNGNKYFDFNNFDSILASYKGKDRFKAMLYRAYYPVNISREMLGYYVSQMTTEQHKISMIFSANEAKMLDTVLHGNDSVRNTEEYTQCFVIPSGGQSEANGVRFCFTSDGTLTKCTQTEKTDIISIPPFIKNIAAGALENIKTDKLILPDGLVSVNPEAFINAGFTHVILNENTALSHRFFAYNKKIRLVTIINTDGTEDTVCYPDTTDDKERERLAFIFVYRIPGKTVNRFSYRDYDLVQLNETENLKRAYYRISSENRPETYDYTDVADKVIEQLQKNNETVRLKTAKNNGYKVM